MNVKYELTSCDSENYKSVSEQCKKFLTDNWCRGLPLKICSANSMIVTAYDNGEMVGVCDIIIGDIDWHNAGREKRMLIPTILIKESHRGKGIGSKILEIVKYISSSENIDICAYVGDSNPHAQRTLELAGFTKIDDEYNYRFIQKKQVIDDSVIEYKK